MRLAATLGAIMAGATPSVAWAAGFDGVWCDERSEERLHIEPRGVGFNEHTVCEWTQGRPKVDAFDTSVVCANLYSDGEGGWVRMNERRVRLQADRSSPEVVMVTVEDGEPAEFTPCEW